MAVVKRQVLSLKPVKLGYDGCTGCMKDELRDLTVYDIQYNCVQMALTFS